MKSNKELGDLTDMEIPNTKKRTRKPTTTPKQKRHRKSGAAAEIDRRIAEIIKARALALDDMAKFAGAQTRYQNLTAELNELINMQARLNAPVMVANPVPPSITHLPVPTSETFNVGAPVPPSVGSIPARTPRVSQTPEGNVGSMVAGEGGFK